MGLESRCDPGPPAFLAPLLPHSSLLTSAPPWSSGQLTRPFPPQGLCSPAQRNLPRAPRPFNPSSNIIMKKSLPSAPFLKHPFLGFLIVRTQRFLCGALCSTPDEGTNILQAMWHSQHHHYTPSDSASPCPVCSRPQPAGTVLAEALSRSQRDSSTRRATCKWGPWGPCSKLPLPHPGQWPLHSGDPGSNG